MTLEIWSCLLKVHSYLLFHCSNSFLASYSYVCLKTAVNLIPLDDHETKTILVREALDSVL